jgi:hypothetical protein
VVDWATTAVKRYYFNSYPSDIKLIVNGTTILQLPHILNTTNYTTTVLTDGSKSKNVTCVTRIPNNSIKVSYSPYLTYIEGYFNISSYTNTSSIDKEYSAYCTGSTGNCIRAYDENWSTTSYVGCWYPSEMCPIQSGYIYETYEVAQMSQANISWTGSFGCVSTWYGGINKTGISMEYYNWTNGTWITAFSKSGDLGGSCIAGTEQFFISEGNFSDIVNESLFKTRVGLSAMDVHHDQGWYIYYYEGKINYTGYPDVYVDAGSDYVWDYNTSYLSTPVKINVNLTALNQEDCGEILCNFTVRLMSQIGGIFNVSNIRLIGDTSTIPLNDTYIKNVVDNTIPNGTTGGYFNISFGINTSILNDVVQINNISILYNGPQNYNITTYSPTATQSYMIYVIWSNYSITLPNTLIDFLYFVPRTNTSQNVTPEGQSTTKQGYNITGYAYDRNYSFYISVNQTPSCISQYVANNSAFTNSILLNTSAQKILNNCSKTVGSWCGGLWFRNNYNCNNTYRYYAPYHNYYTKCEECL